MTGEPEPTNPTNEPETEAARMKRVLMETALDREPATPDDPETAAMRHAIESEAEQMRAKGQIMDIPSDWTDWP